MMLRTTSSESAKEAIERRGSGERDEARKARAEDATSAFLGGDQRGRERGGGRESVIESRGPKGVKENEHGSGERGVADGDGQRGEGEHYFTPALRQVPRRHCGEGKSARNGKGRGQAATMRKGSILLLFLLRNVPHHTKARASRCQK